MRRNFSCGGAVFFYSIGISLIILAILSIATADCGCGVRCEKYENDVQCTRCCTATVRRSILPENYSPSGLKSNTKPSIENSNFLNILYIF